MSSRSSLTVTSGTTITSAWGNGIRDHIVARTTSDDVSSEGQLCVNTSADTLVTHNGTGAVAIANYGLGSSWTPAITQSFAVAATVNLGRYWINGRRCKCEFQLTCTGFGSASNAIVISGLPVTANASVGAQGYGYLYDASASNSFPFIVTLGSTTTIKLSSTSANAADLSLGVTSFTAALATNDIINATFEYTY